MDRTDDIKVGDPARDFSLKDQDGNAVSLSDMLGKWLVLYFYPKDNTSGCTLEAIEFTRRLGDFSDLGAEVVGVSPDSEESHRKFTDEHELKLTLGADTDRKVLDSYCAWVPKKMYGRESMGVNRSTFLIGPDGTVRHIWRNVKVDGHADEVLSRLRELHG